MTPPLHPQGEGWIAWEGGECPVPYDAIVEVQCRDGFRSEGFASEFSGSPSWNWWKHEPARYEKDGFGFNHADIVAYRPRTPDTLSEGGER